MKFWVTILLFTLLLGAAGCKKKKELSAWAKYQAGAETSIAALQKLETYNLDDNNLDKFKEDLKSTEVVVNKFLQESQTEIARASRQEIDAAVQDFRMTVELADKRRASSGDQFFANKLFASTDAELFAKVKQKYQLGPELVVAAKPYYFIDSIIHEAWRSAGRHIDRAGSKLTDEAAEEAKAAKAAKAGKAKGDKDKEKEPEKAKEPVKPTEPEKAKDPGKDKAKQKSREKEAKPTKS